MRNHIWIYNIIFGIIIFGLQCGCANQNSIHRTLDINEGNGVLIDIKQRAIIVKDRTVNGKTMPVVCAEPSPDALSAFASALSGQVDVYSKVKVGMESQTQENASFVGLRTQSIQLLRDFLYRDCEAYMNEAIDKYQYDILMRRNQKYMVALLGVEQLTGVIAFTPSTLNTTIPPTKQVTPNKEEANNNESSGTVDNTTTGITIKTSTETAISDTYKKYGDKKNKKDVLTNNDELTKTSDSAKNNNPTKIEEPSKTEVPANGKSNMELIAGVVNNIVTQILQTDDIGQSCFAYLAGSQFNANEKLSNICSDYLSKVANKKIESNKVSSVCIDILTKVVSSGAKPDQILNLMDKLYKTPLCLEPSNPIVMKSLPPSLKSE